MFVKSLFLILLGAGYGLLAAAGVFTVFVAVGLVPRFAGKTHTARKVFLYEEMVVFGTLVGCVITVFPEYFQVGKYLRETMPGRLGIWEILGSIMQVVYGLFSGMFIGCLALAIAEMLDSIPIFARRISFRHGIGLAILSLALGKVTGALFYFWQEMHRLVQ